MRGFGKAKAAAPAETQEVAEQVELDAEMESGNEGDTDVQADVQEETSAPREFRHDSYPP